MTQIAERKAEKLGNTLVNFKAKALVDTLGNKLGETKAGTFCDTLGDIGAWTKQWV